MLIFTQENTVPDAKFGTKASILAALTQTITALE